MPSELSIVGAGFIGLEMAENLQAPWASQVTVSRDARPGNAAARPGDGVSGGGALCGPRELNLILGDAVSPDSQRPMKGSWSQTQSGAQDPRGHGDSGDRCASLRPPWRNRVALAVGERGGIVVDDVHADGRPRHIYAVGDAVEVGDVVTGESAPVLALARPGQPARVASRRMPSSARNQWHFAASRRPACVVVFDHRRRHQRAPARKRCSAPA